MALDKETQDAISAAVTEAVKSLGGGDKGGRRNRDDDDDDGKLTPKQMRGIVADAVKRAVAELQDNNKNDGGEGNADPEEVVQEAVENARAEAHVREELLDAGIKRSDLDYAVSRMKSKLNDMSERDADRYEVADFVQELAGDAPQVFAAGRKPMSAEEKKAAEDKAAADKKKADEDKAAADKKKAEEEAAEAKKNATTGNKGTTTTTGTGNTTKDVADWRRLTPDQVREGIAKTRALGPGHVSV